MFSFTLDIYCTSVRPWERDPSHVALSEVSTFFLPVKRVFSSFSLLLLRVKGRGCHTLLKPYETNCGLWILAIQIKFDWLIDDWSVHCPNNSFRFSTLCRLVSVCSIFPPFLFRQLPRKYVLELYMLPCSLCSPFCFTRQIKHALPTSGNECTFKFDSLSFGALGSTTWVRRAG